MSNSFTITETATFTITHSQHITAKVATDLKRMLRFYGQPSDAEIATFEQEIVQLLKYGYLGTVSYGFRRTGAFIPPTVIYTPRDLAGASAVDDDPGRVPPGANVTGASFYSFLTYSAAWSKLTDGQRETFARTLPFQRTGAPQPAVNGYLRSDRCYSAGGRALDRQSVTAF